MGQSACLRCSARSLQRRTPMATVTSPDTLCARAAPWAPGGGLGGGLGVCLGKGLGEGLGQP